jgi:fumarate hydratase subunit beta
MKGVSLVFSPPFTDDIVRLLKAGDRVSITGTLYTARDAAHKRLVDLVKARKPLPVDLNGQIIYYCGPTPTPPGKITGSAGPTTSGRMDRFTPVLLEKTGLKAMIGKGNRSLEVVSAIKAKKAVYFAAIGGAAALLSTFIKKSEIVCYEDLGAEAIYRLTVEKFPVIVAIDCEGNNLYVDGPEKFRNSDHCHPD